MRLCTGATALAALAALAACQPRATPPATVVAGAGPAEVACVAAVQTETGTTGASVRSSQVTGAGTSVMVSVPGAEAPWSCVASSDGVVTEVRYSGSEGALCPGRRCHAAGSASLTSAGAPVYERASAPARVAEW